MYGDELRVVQAFCLWLEARGWATQREVKYADITAERNGEQLYAEAKGRTAAVGLDVDTLYGQLLRRMPAEAIGKAVFAVVVPNSAVKAAERVSERVRAALGIEIYSVSESGGIQHVSSGVDPLE